MSGQWSPEAISALGATTDLPTLGSIFGVGRWRAYQMGHTGEWEQLGIRIIPVGTKYRVVVQSIMEVLGGDAGTLDEIDATRGATDGVMTGRSSLPGANRT